MCKQKVSYDTYMYTPHSLKVEVQFRLWDSYHFLIASGVEIGRQEVFSSTWQLLEQTILTATAQDFSATVSESRSIFIQRRALKHTTFSHKTVFQNSRGFSVECKYILKPKFLYNNRKNQFVGCDDSCRFTSMRSLIFASPDCKTGYDHALLIEDRSCTVFNSPVTFGPIRLHETQ